MSQRGVEPSLNGIGRTRQRVYTALGGRKIYSNAGTLTASIGVILELANTEKLYQWAKVDRYTLKAGKFKDAGSPLRPMKPEERELLTNMLLDGRIRGYSQRAQNGNNDEDADDDQADHTTQVAHQAAH